MVAGRGWFSGGGGQGVAIQVQLLWQAFRDSSKAHPGENGGALASS